MLKSILDTLSIALIFISFVILIKNRDKIKETDSILFGGLLLLLFGYFVLLFIDSEEFENILGALIPVLFAFVFYSIIQKQKNDELEQNEEKLRLAVDATKAGLWNLDFDRNELIISESWFDILRYKPSELNPITLEKWGELIHPEDLKASKAQFIDHLKKKTPLLESMIRIRHKDQSWVWFQLRGKVVNFSDDGRALRMTGTLIDLSKQKELELNLKQQLDTNKLLFEQNEEQSATIADNQEKYRVLYENSNDAIILIKDHLFFDCNKKSFELFKCEPNYLLDQHPAFFSPKIQPDGETSEAKAARYFAKVEEGEAIVFDWQHIRPNGELFDVSVSLNAVVLGSEKYVQAVLRDITKDKRIAKELEAYRNNLEQLVDERTAELRQSNEELRITMRELQDAQAQLIQAEKMASLGILTAGIAHEINNPLNFIMGGYRGLQIFLKEPLKEDEQLAKLLDSIKIGADRAIDIVKGLNQFSRTREELDEECNIPEILDNCLLLLNNRIKSRIEVEKNYHTDLPKITGNVGKLHQVFINLIHNASDAISDEGNIQVSANPTGAGVWITIEDDGMGVKKKDLKKLTDPFFTTKPPGKGTGLGLSLSYSFIKEHKGKLEIESEEGEGTKVKVFLPLTH
ncbi:ATP-binding protein [Reichenbachiella ulvae]|uniref:histidine kinase n=1 Tax=Reichenbachiella ulvae TaxID=2980104 RepID=A0ABT3CVS8_9BACT|nr:ATP-binding protein [Reichenbachiella ulvae]MCV9387807.1 ATP-binding protein [Reichenbachiella ulvae]